MYEITLDIRNKNLIWWKNEQLLHFGTKFNFYFYFIPYHSTFKFLKMKCNPTNKKTGLNWCINWCLYDWRTEGLFKVSVCGVDGYRKFSLNNKFQTCWVGTHLHIIMDLHSFTIVVRLHFHSCVFNAHDQVSRAAAQWLGECRTSQWYLLIQKCTEHVVVIWNCAGCLVMHMYL